MEKQKRITGYHAFVDGRGGYLANSGGQIRDKPSFADWLLDNWQNKQINVCYDLDAFAACLFRLFQLDKQEADRLHRQERLSIYEYDITYFPGRFLSISKGKDRNRPYIAFHDMSRYIEPLIHSKDGIIEKAVKARDIATEIQNALVYIGGGIDSSAVGSITKAIKPVMQRLTIPTHLDVPLEVVQLALDNVKGNWVEAFKIGYCPEVYDLDISGAYASFLATMPDLRLGQWIESSEIPDKALLGFATGRVTRNSSFSPLLYRQGDSLHGVVGSWNDTLNLAEIKHIRYWSMDDFQFQSGWWWVPNGELKYPYRGIINWLWSKRQASSGMAKDQIKRMMAYLWGQTLADYGREFGEYYNPVYGAYVESLCRLKVSDFVFSHGLENNLLHVAVDGAIFDCPVDVPTNSELGKWRLSYKSQAIIVNSGYVFVEGKAGTQEFAHSFEWLKPQLESNPEAMKYGRSKNTVVSLTQAVTQDCLDKLGLLQSVSENVEIGKETKRLYLKNPKTGRELLSGLFESSPLSIDSVRAMS